MVHVPLKPELLPPNQSAPVPRLVKPRVPLSGALIVAALLPAESNGQQVIAGVEPVLSSVRVLLPPMVQLAPLAALELPNTRFPIVRDVSRVTVGAVDIDKRLNVAVLPAPLAIVLLAQSAATLQFALAATAHEPLAARDVSVAPSSSNPSKAADKS